MNMWMGVPHCSLVWRTVRWVSLLIVALCRRLRALGIERWKGERRVLCLGPFERASIVDSEDRGRVRHRDRNRTGNCSTATVWGVRPILCGPD